MTNTKIFELWSDTPQQRKPLYWYLSIRTPIRPRHQEICAKLLAAIEYLRPSTRGFTADNRRVERQAVEWFIEGLFQSSQCMPPVPLGLPFKRNYYTGKHPIRVPFPHKTIIRIRQACVHLEWIRIELGNEFRKEISRIWPAGELLEYFRGIPAQWFEIEPQPADKLIMMTIDSKRALKRVVGDDEHPMIQQWRQNLYKINTFLCTQCIYLDIPDEQIRTIHLNRQGEDEGHIWFLKVELRRVFNSERFDHGGRFYGAWWQTVPKEFRRFIRINGEPTIEIDFKGMAIRSLYAREGMQPPDDPYSVPKGQEDKGEAGRQARKSYTTAALNDKKKRYRAKKEDLKTLGLKKTKDLRDKIIEAHPFLEPWLHSGVGIELQYIDSEIAERVMLRLIAKGIACLPIHDSFIVMKSAQQDLFDAMMDAYLEVTGISSGVSVKEGIINQGVWHLPDQKINNDEEAIMTAWEVQLNERYPSARNYYETWMMETKSQGEIDKMFIEALRVYSTLQGV